MNGLVLSGAGGGIGYLGGAVSTLTKKYRYDKIVGVSSGALVGIMYAIDRLDRLKEILFHITDRQVVRKRPLRFGISTLFGGSMGYYSNAPLRKLLTNELRGHTTEIDFTCVAVNARTGKPIWWQIPKGTHLTGGSLNAFVSMILSSTAIPVAFSPEKIGDEYYVDGGVSTHTPIQPMKDLLPQANHISIVSTALQERSETGVGIIQLTGGVIGDLVSSISERDFMEFEFKNKLALQGHPDYRYFDNIIIRPEKPLSPTTRFHYQFTQPDWAHGERMALLAMG
jgi:predicted acylesterase/phospholipase RssA